MLFQRLHTYVCTYYIIVYKVWLMHKMYNVGFKKMKLRYYGDMAFLTMLGFIYSAFLGEMSKKKQTDL